jgi:hypothetical protein
MFPVKATSMAAVRHVIGDVHLHRKTPGPTATYVEIVVSDVLPITMWYKAGHIVVSFYCQVFNSQGVPQHSFPEDQPGQDAGKYSTSQFFLIRPAE